MTIHHLLTVLAALSVLARVVPLLAQAPAPPAPAAPAQLSIRFEGHNAPEDAAKAVGTLLREGIITSATAAQDPDTPGICGVLIAQTQIPGKCGEELREIGKDLNPRLQSNALSNEARIRYPVVTFQPYTYVRMFSRTSEEGRRELSDVRKRWRAFIEKEDAFGDFVVLTLRGSELVVPIDPAKAGQLDKVMKLNSKDVFVDVEGVSNRVQMKFTQTTDEALSFEEFCQGPAPGKVYRYIDLIGGFQDPIPACKPEDGQCADVVILDTPVFPHPAIASSVVNGARSPSPAPSTPAGHCMRANEYKRELYHGTHMAGIIASSGGQFPLAGVHSGARLYSRDWDTMGVKDTAQEMVRRYSERGTTLQVYLFASAWSTTGGSDLYLGDPANRYNDSTPGSQLGKRIKDMAPLALWVAAAGQKDLTSVPPIKEPLNISSNLALSPMNLGDLPNVVVVTACDDCQGLRQTGPTLTRDVNYSSTGMVHVAAPGLKVPSPADQFQYASAGGTSEAAAFVAGLASALVAKFPGKYDAGKVKARLQYTATPWVPSTGNVVASGIVDATTALLDPDKDHLNGKPVEIEGWCRAPDQPTGFTVLDDNGELVPGGHVPSQLVYRIVQQMAGGQRQWFIYAVQSLARLASNPGEVLRVGPGTPTVLGGTGSAAERPIIKLKHNAGVVKLNGIRDLLVRRGALHPVVCS